MTRTRLLNPGFFKNEDLADLSHAARLCYAGLWCLADREGRLEDRPKRIKIELFPYDADVDVEDLLQHLERKQFIIRYRIGPERFIAIPKFLEHQSPHVREAKSVIPAPADSQSSQDETQVRLGGAEANLGVASSLPRSPVLVSVSVHSNGTGARTKDALSVLEERFDRFWIRYPRQEQREPARMIWLEMGPSEPVTLEILGSLEAHRRSAAWAEAIAGRDYRYIPYAKNWLRDRLWLERPAPGDAPKGATCCRHLPKCADDALCTEKAIQEREAAWRGPVISTPHRSVSA